MDSRADFFSSFEKDRAQDRTNRIGKAYMTDHPITEERIRAALCLIKELARNHHVPGVNRFFHRPHCTDADDPLHTHFFHSEDVGSEVNGRGLDAVTLPVAGQKNDLYSFETP